ncbi:MAG: hypothetical protein DMG32_00045 [Acidobacteria bacterium]|nr:MAG: hypothetical protein DMG32_00045 [Acidobacteriota bacterium]
MVLLLEAQVGSFLLQKVAWFAGAFNFSLIPLLESMPQRKYLTHSFLMPIVTASRFRWLKRSISLCYVTFKTDLQGESRSGKRRASGIPLERERGSQTSN